MREWSGSAQLGADFAGEQAIDRAGVAIENTEGNAGLDEADAGELPVVEDVAGDGGIELDARRQPAEIGNDALIAIGAGGTVGGMPEVQLVAGGKLQLEDIGADFAIDLVEILGPGEAALKLKAVLEVSANAGLQGVVIGNEGGVGEERALADSLDGESGGDVVDGVVGLSIDRILGAGEESLVELVLSGAMVGIGANVTDVKDVAVAQGNLDVEVVLLGAAVEDVGVGALNEGR